MNKLKLLILSSLLTAVQAFAATEFNLTFSTVAPGGSYNPKNCVAVWVTTSGGTFVKTICRYAGTRKSDLTSWYAAAGSSDADAVMGATRPNHSTPARITATWDLKNKAGAVVPDGSYLIKFEMTDGTRVTYNYTFVKDGIAGTRTVPGSTKFTSATLVYNPPAPANTAPVALSQSVTNAEDTALGIVLNATDAETNALTYAIATGPSHGTLSAISLTNRLTYTPATNYYGPDSFTFTARDASLTSTPATVSITVTAVNDAPVAQPQSVAATAGIAKAITLAATDADGDALTYSIATTPAHGTLSAISSNQVTYTPAVGYSGSDSFTFTARDASLSSTPATVSISVTLPNTAPVAQAQSVSTAEDTAKAITLAATDAEGNPLTYLIATTPSHGTLSAVVSNQVTYTPAANYFGSDSFTFTAKDSSLTSTPATVSITVTAVNDAPVAQAQSVSTAEDTAKAITLVATDVEGSALTYLVATGPSHGTLSAIVSNQVTYTPAANYFGSDSFTFTARDASLTSTPATVSITVTAVNDSPVAQAQSVSTAEDTAKTVTLAATDAEGDALTYLVATGPSHGTLSAIVSNQVTYTPALNYNGPDSFTFTAKDASLTSTPATVSITVTAVNDSPVAQAQSVSTAEDTAKIITLAATDADGDALTYLVAAGPAHGTLSAVTSNQVTYTPALNYNGPDSFTFQVADASLTSTPATVSITVTPVNDAPVAQAQSISTSKNTPKVVALVATDVDGDALTYLIASSPAHGTLSAVSSNQVTYTPAANYFGPDSFTFTARDASLTSTPVTVSIMVMAMNEPPMAQPQSVSTAEDTAKAITLVATDMEGDPLTYLIATGPAHGTLSAVSSNQVTYTPALNYNGPDSFTFQAADASLTSTPATVSITVTAVNDSPVAQGQSVTTAEDTAKIITLAATDADGDALTYLVATGPSHGTLSAIVSNQVTYTPSLNYNGPDSFTFTARDSSLTSTPATVSITVTPVNDAPVAQAQSVSTLKDAAKTIVLLATDVENDLLTYVIASLPAHGTLSAIVSNQVTYTPAANYFGPDSFTFTARDSSLTSTPAMVSITVTQVNTVPVAQAQSVTTAEDAAKAITLAATDAEGDALTYLIATGPSHGTLSAIVSNQVTYTPALNYSGPDSFTFSARDASLTSTPATVSITVTSVNDAPAAQAQSVTTAEDAAKAVTLAATDAEGDALTYLIATGPSHGTLSAIVSNQVTYTPALNYSGPDSFTFTARDASLTSTPATVSITVTALNDAPVAQGQSVTTAEDAAKTVTLAATDPDGDVLTYQIAAGPAHGTLSGVTSNQVTYTPAANYNGPDSFTFQAADASLTSTPATVSITVTPVNDAPAAQAQSVTTAEDTPLVVTLAGTDAEGDPLAYQIAAAPAHGTLSAIVSNQVTYTPALNYNGPDSFTFTARDASLTSTPATVSITVTPVNDAPVAQAQSVTTAKDTAKTITLVATDVDGDALTYIIATSPSHGVLSVLSSNRVTYTPGANYFGPDSFTFTARDASLTSTPATVSITVSQVNTVPVAQAQSVSTAEDTAKAITLAATDAEGDSLTYLIATGPAHGTLSAVSSNLVTYTPAANYNGADSFTFQSTDGSLTSTPATVSITVTPVNDAPAAQAQSVSTSEDTAKVITLVATDVENDPLTYLIASNPVHGTLSVISSNQVTYTPALNYNGPDSFTFTARDASLTSTPATVSITVTAVNDAPVAQPQDVTTEEDKAVAVTLVATDAENTPSTYLISTAPAHGTLSAVSSNRVTYTPATNYFGPDSFTFRASDGSLTGTTATVSITVTPVNDAPVAQGQSVNTVRDTAKIVTLVATDVENDTLTYLVQTGPLHGTLSAVSSNRVTYTPAANYIGPDSFTFVALDSSLTSTPATVSISVTSPSSVPPVAQGQSVTTVEDTAVAITLVATNGEKSALTYSIATGPAHGTLSAVSSNRVTYTPAANYNGADSFTFTASDGFLSSTPATVSITVTAVNDAPVALDQTVTTPVNTSISIAMAGTDAEGDPLTFAVLTDPAHGTLGRVMFNKVTYIPAANFNGYDSFTFRCKDGSLTGTPATVYIKVGAFNTAPVLGPLPNLTVVVGEPLAFRVVAYDTDIPSNTLTFALGTPPVPPANAATLDPQTGQFVWTPANADEGKVFSFTVSVTDNGVPPLSTNQTFQVSVMGYPPVLGIQLLNGFPHIVWNSVQSRRYQLQYTDNLMTPAWRNLGGEATATGPLLSYDDEAMQSHTNRFYRVLLLPQ